LGDVHTSLITYARDQLRRVLPADLRPRVEERVFVEVEDGHGRSIYPDVRAVERPFAENGGYLQHQVGGPAVAVAEPIVIELEHEEDRTLHRDPRNRLGRPRHHRHRVREPIE
jgi:hypothetical protein